MRREYGTLRYNNFLNWRGQKIGAEVLPPRCELDKNEGLIYLLTGAAVLAGAAADATSFGVDK